MREIAHAIQYYRFMKWFKNNHFKLYDQYKLHILVPDEGYNIKVSMDHVAPQDRELLQAAIGEYNTKLAD